jgi:hypothetical protein
MEMQIPIHHPKFEGMTVELVKKGLFSPPGVVVDGTSLNPKESVHTVKTVDGASVTIEMRGSLIDPLPKLTVDGETYLLAPALRWYEWMWLAMPILLVFAGGAIGGGIGGVAFYGNLLIFRSSKNTFAKYGATALVSLAAVLVWFFVGTSIHLAL